MSDYNYDTYCGLYCGSCSVLKAYQSGIKDPLACMFSDELGMELKCHGCKTDNLFENCAQCTIRPCAKEKEVEHCIDCADYPCQIYRTLEFAAEKLPHWTMVADNVEIIKYKGAEKWLEEQAVQWKCPDCQTDYTWYGTHCSNCGKELGDLKSYKNTFDKSIFQMTMPNPDEMFKKEVVFTLKGMEQVRTQKDMVYSGEQGNELLLDLYLPPSPLLDKKMPVVVLVHGETPVPNLKDSGQYNSLGRLIAASGFAAVAFNHCTLMQGAGIKDVIEDIETLIKYLIDNADELGIDKDQICIWSFSMGVPFGLFAGMHNNSANIKCMVAYYGFGDFTSLCNLLRRTDQRSEEYSPVQLLSQNPDKVAPMFIARAGIDQIPTILSSLDTFIGAALANNISIDVYNHPTGVHAFDLYNDDPRTHEIIAKTLEFLKKHLSEL